MANDLVQLAKVKTFLGVTDSSADAILAQLITSQSSLFRSKVMRDILYKTYVETRDGNGTKAMEPRQYPVKSVTSVLIDQTTIPAQPAYVSGQTPPYGWVLVDDRIEIEGSWPCGIPPETYVGDSQPATFRRGNGNVLLTYKAGFLALDEAGTIPASSTYTVQSGESFVSDQGVKFSVSGTALVAVSGAPTAGQYSVSATGLYTFNATDAGKGVLLTYAYVPADIEQAVIDMVQWNYKGRGHVGERSKAGIAGESVVFQTDAIPPSAQAVIDIHARMTV
jgi:hypothetical protein